MWIFWTILLTIIGVGLMLYSFHKDDKLKGLYGFISSFIILIAFLIYGFNVLEPAPTALDVYRGNTELKITSVNGIPTDSVVVFKNK
jgi:hypothetical protein